MSRCFALAVLLLAAVVIGCGSADSERGGGGVEAPAGLSLVIYREAQSNTVFAEQLPGERRWRFSGGSEEELLLAMDCSGDGQRAAYVTRHVESGVRLKIGGKSGQIAISGDVSGLAWAPDGSQIAVTTFDASASSNQLQLVDAESGELSVAASGQGGIGPPSWSPDSSRIAFDASDGTVNQIFLHTIGAEGASKLYERQSSAFAPDWSPDGLRLVFSAVQGDIYQIFSVNADGADEVQVTTSNVSKGVPRWAPDGSLIAFAGTVVAPAVSEQAALVHNLAVYTARPDGSDERAVTDLANDARFGGWCVSGPWLGEDWEAV